MKIAHLDPVSLRVLRASIDAAMRSVGETHGLSIAAGRATYDPAGKYATFKLEIALVGEGGAVQSREAEAYKRHAQMFGLKPEFLNQSFVDRRGVRYTLLGYKQKARANAFLVRDEKNKDWLVNVEVIRLGFRDQLPVSSTPAAAPAGP